MIMNYTMRVCIEIAIFSAKDLVVNFQYKHNALTV